MTTIVQLSDTHFGTEVPAVVHAAREAVRAIAPDLVVMSGDITQRARPREFRAAQAFLASLPGAPRLTIPGNHDLPLFNPLARLFWPYRGYRRHFGACNQLWFNGDVGIVGFDATARVRHTRGKLDAREVCDLVAEARRQLPSDALLLACVHQPLETLWQQDEPNVLIDVNDTARLLAALKVDAVLTGHVHVPLLTTTRKRFPSLPRHFVLCGAGTALSHRVRAGVPNSFNVIRVTKKQLAIVEYRYEAVARKFIARPAACFARGEDGWMTR